jgi:thiol-disulfide isomerase/thioredoxin
MRSVHVSNTVRWNLVGVAVVLALIVALWPRTSPTQSATPDAPPATQGQSTQEQPTQDRLSAAAIAAALQPCPSGDSARTAGPLKDLTLECLGGGPVVDLATALGGKPAVLNLWAWWCGPCAKELPVMQEFSRRAGAAVTVLAVHSDPSALKALQALRDYGVHLPSVQDPQQRVSALTGAPAAYPATVLLRADGTVARVLAVAFPSADAIAEAVDQWLGVRV